MKQKLLFLLLLTTTLINANTVTKTPTGPSIGLIMQANSIGGNMIQFHFLIKNTGDVPLTNIYITESTNPMNGPMDISTTPTFGLVINLAPGEENSYTFNGFKYSYMSCYDISQTIVHATTPGNVEITDLSHPYDYYQDDNTFTPFYEYLGFEQDGVYNDLNNNSIVDVGDVINYTYTLNVNASYIQNFIVTDTNAVLQNPNCDNCGSWNSTGIHYLTQAEVNSGYVYNCPSLQYASMCGNEQYQFYDPTPCINCPSTTNCYNTITTKITDLLPNKIIGNVKFNSNSDNCATGANFSNRKIDVTEGATTYTSYTNSNGNYNVYIPNTGNYTVTALTNLSTNFTSNPTSASIISAGENIDYTSDFCISSSTNYTDLGVALYPIDHARPGFNSNYRLYYTNNGSTALNGSVQLTYDNSKLSLVTAIPSQNSTTSNMVSWSYTNLLPFEYRYIDIRFNAFVPPTVNQGDNLSFTVVANPVAGDNNPANNTFNLNQTVVSSYDPNDKTVLEGATISQSQVSEYLHYITRFQNTGTAAATTVVLKEILDNDLDWTTFEPVGSSHNYNIQIKNGNDLTCTFSNINLLDSTTNEPASHGWLAYKIKPKSTFTTGNVATSQSGIYFDYNPPIITNTVNTQVNPLSTAEFEKHTFEIYPNPATNYFTIVNNSADFAKYEISDINGKLLSIGDMETMKQIDVSQLQNGLYFVTIKTANLKQTYKIVKQ